METKKYVGEVQAVREVKLQSGKTVYSFTLYGVNGWFRTGSLRFPYKKDDVIEFTANGPMPTNQVGVNQFYVEFATLKAVNQDHGTVGVTPPTNPAVTGSGSLQPTAQARPQSPAEQAFYAKLRAYVDPNE